jgi:myo-inositol catabolism protein IolC
VEVERAQDGARTLPSGLATSIPAISQSGKCLASCTHKPFGSRRERFIVTDTPATGPALAGASPAPGGQADDRVLLILAADHRDSLERDLYGLTAPPTPAQAARISADKLLVYQALLDAVRQLPAAVQPGMLIDEQYGASVAELASRSAGAVSLCMPLEASGEQWFSFAYGDDWQRHAGFFAAEHAKVLVRDNPGLDPGLRERQAQRLAQVSAWAAAANKSLILGLLVPATHADEDATGGRADRYDDELRPGHTLKVMEYLQDHGVEPAIWKVEGLDRHDDAVAVAAMAVRAGRQARCVVLGRHAPHDKLEHWLQVAAPIPGWMGFAIGRSIWQDPLHARLHHFCTTGEARRRIANTYLNYARYYLRAREGTLTEPDPVL